jgi:hypothetical protein
VAYLKRGGSIIGRWGSLVLADDEIILIVTKDSVDRVLTGDELRVLFESRAAIVDEAQGPAGSDETDGLSN